MNTLELSASLRTAIFALHKTLRGQSSMVGKYSMAEAETIGHLMRNPALLPTELATRTRVKTQSMTHILNKLEEQGVIKRTPSKEDKRKVYISITPVGKKLVEKLKHEWDDMLKETLEKALTAKEREQLVKVLPVLNKLVESKTV